MLKELKKGTSKEEFVSKAGTREIKAPRRKGTTLDKEDVNFFKLMIFGASGVGKTHLLGEFVRDLGLKLAILSTDVGESGHLTIITQLESAGKGELKKNVYLLPLEGWGEVSDFLYDPYRFAPDLWAFDPDIIAWDGFSGFQQLDVSEYVGNMKPKENTDGSSRDRGDARESGLFFEQADWGVVKVATGRTIDKFLSLKNPSDKPLHKIVTCLEAIEYKSVDPNKKQGAQQMVEAKKPLLQGSGSVLTYAGFDIIARAKVKVHAKDSGPVREYQLVTEGHENLVAKNRGFPLDSVIPNSAVYLWERIQQGLGITRTGSEKAT